jgi:hypothetical protein
LRRVRQEMRIQARWDEIQAETASDINEPVAGYKTADDPGESRMRRASRI